PPRVTGASAIGASRQSPEKGIGNLGGCSDRLADQATSALRYIVTTAAPPRPRLCWSATFAPGTCRLSATPRSCQLSSAHCASPVAPSGWPFEISPPDGFTTT